MTGARVDSHVIRVPVSSVLGFVDLLFFQSSYFRKLQTDFSPWKYQTVPSKRVLTGFGRQGTRDKARQIRAGSLVRWIID